MFVYLLMVASFCVVTCHHVIGYSGLGRNTDSGDSVRVNRAIECGFVVSGVYVGEINCIAVQYRAIAIRREEKIIIVVLCCSKKTHVSSGQEE